MNKTLLACALALASIGSASAATITPVNTNAPNIGLNDPAAATPVGLNPGVTVGEQRRIAYQFAADLWGAVLQSNVEIRVNAQFTPLSCTATSGTLGSAGSATVHANFTGGVTDTWYGAALANSIAGTDLGTTSNDINSNFNSNLGTTGCLEGSGWYYGLDGKTPAGKINFLDVVMHEIGHGLNFQGFYSTTTGAPFGTAPNVFPDIYSSFVFDNASGKTWVSMTNAERLTARTQDQLVWTGATVNAQVPTTLAPQQKLFTTGTLIANYDYGTAAFGPVPAAANFNGAVALVNDGSVNPSQGCVASPAGAYAGKVAIVDRGTCAFEIKARFAQDAGAIAVIIANNAAGIISMAEDATVNATVPTVSVSQADGMAIKAALPGVNAAVGVVAGRYAGADATGRARLYAPAVFAAGSTFSHFDISHSPNALQEPSISSDLDANYRVDLSPALYRDLGWGLRTANASFGACTTTTVPVLAAPGLIAGANLEAMHDICSTGAGLARPVYRRCMTTATANLVSVGLINSSQALAINACATRPN